MPDEGAELDLAEIGRRIRLAREKRGLTRGQLGYQTGVSATTIARIERGAGSNPTAQLLFRHLHPNCDSE